MTDAYRSLNSPEGEAVPNAFGPPDDHVLRDVPHESPSYRRPGAYRGVMLVPGRGAVLTPPPLPLQFPSLAAFDDRMCAVCQHLEGVEGIQLSTIRWGRTSLRRFRRYLVDACTERRFLGGDIRDQADVLRGWVATLRGEGLSRVTVNDYWRGLSLVLSRLNHLDGVVNPLALLPPPRFSPSAPRFLPRHTAEELLRFVRQRDWGKPLAGPRALAAVGLMLLAGLRRGEVLRLTFGDVDVDAGTIRVIRGKGRWGGKDRTAYMPPQLREILTAYVAARRRAGRTDAAFILNIERGGFVSEITLRRILGIVSKGIGVPVTPHMLRHTYATLLRQAGVADRLAMDLLGHTSLEMLQRYSHVESGEHRSAVTRLVLSIDL